MIVVARATAGGFMPMPPLQMCVHALQLAAEAEHLTIDVGLLLTE
jgi:hypothetical protein